MTAKLLIMALCTVAGSMGGLVFSNRLKSREAFYKSVVVLTETLISEVSFKKSAVKSVMTDFMAHNRSPLNVNLREYVECENPDALSLSKSVLNAAEAHEMLSFLRSLGRSDAHTQIKELENYKRSFLARLTETESASKKFGPMYVKLGFFAGLTLGIVLL